MVDCTECNQRMRTIMVSENEVEHECQNPDCRKNGDYLVIHHINYQKHDCEQHERPGVLFVEIDREGSRDKESYRPQDHIDPLANEKEHLVPVPIVCQHPARAVDHDDPDTDQEIGNNE